MKRSRTPSPSFSSEPPDDPTLSRLEKYVLVESDASKADVISCNLPPHRLLSFDSYDAYERHYQQNHVNRCLECQSNFPTELFLERHIAENHDPFTAAKHANGEKIFGCFVEDCGKICATWHKRKLHLIDKHGYPKDFDFFVVNDGVDGRTSLLRSGRIPPIRSDERSRSLKREAQVSQSAFEHGDVDALSGPMRSLHIIPSKVKFGGKKAPPG